MAAIDFPTATSNGQTFEADSGVIYTYVGTPPNGFWSGTFATTGLNTLDGRYIAKNDENNIQTIQTQGLKLNSGNGDTILLDGLNGKIGIGTTSPSVKLQVDGTGVEVRASDNANSKNISLYGGTSANDPAITFTDALRFYSNSVSAERMRIDSSGRVGIGTTAPLTTLECRGQFSVSNSSSSYWVFDRDDSDGRLKLLDSSTSTNERLAIDTSGRLLVGTSTSVATANGYTPGLQVAAQLGSISAASYRSDEFGGIVAIQKSRSATVGTQTVVGNNDQCGLFSFEGSDGSSFKALAQISAYVDGTPGANDMPGRLVFSTTANNSSSPTERMRIDNAGKLVVTDIGSTAFLSGANSFAQVMISSNVGGLIINSVDTTASSYCRLMFTPNGNITGNEGLIRYSTNDYHMSFWTQGNERMRFDSSGNVGIGGSGSSFANQKSLSLFAGSSTVARLDFYNSDGSTREAEIISYSGNSESLRLSGITNRAMTFHTNNTEKMRIDSAGNVGIGTSSPSTALHLGNSSTLRINNQNGTRTLDIFNDNTFAEIKADVDPIRLNAEHSSAYIRFDTNGSTERMRITGAGDLCVGTSSAIANGLINVLFSTARNGMVMKPSSSTLDQNYILFVNSAGTQTGRIAQNGTTTVNYAASSDYRLKENVVAMTGGINRLKQLTPKQFNFIGESDRTVDGFLAHEAQDVVPEAVIGTKDEVDDNGNAVMQGIDQSKLVPLLTAALQEGIAKIETLEGVDRSQFQNTSALLNQPLITFLNNSGAVAGEVIHSGINSVTYATSSDYRLKENVTDLTAAIPRLKNLAPKRFNFIGADEVTVDGFLAHEAQTVVPEAVTGTHNEVDGDGNAVMQGIDQAKLVPLLTAALQEAITKIETLETKVAALEAA